MIDLHAAMSELAETRPVFHAEADFQHALAWHLRRSGVVSDVRLEKPLSREGRRIRIDLFAEANGAWHAIELKYWTRRLDLEHGGDDYILANQAAQDISRYDFWRDVARMERVVRRGEAASAWVIALSNDRTYWTAGRSGTIDEELRLHHGRSVNGPVGWSSHASAGSMKSRESRHELTGSYSVLWRPYSSVSESLSGEFQYLAMEIAS